jgi:hypothetical protein
MISRLPTAEEINVFDSLDERCAVANFLGKDLEQAQELFRDSFQRYQEDLSWMGPKAFRFYVPAAINYLLSSDSKDDGDAVSSFYYLIDHALHWDAAKLPAVALIIREGIVGILAKFDQYNFDQITREKVAARYQRLLSRLQQ